MNTATLVSEPDSSQTEFWNKRWTRGKIPWDLGGVPPALMSFLCCNRTPTRVLIPGCGSGYEVRAFHEAGLEVTAIEFSAPAVARAREVLGSLGDKVILGDFFKHDFGRSRYGLIYERGFLCSLPPARWPDYASRMMNLLSKGGKLVGLFLYGREVEPPPFPLTKKTAASLLGGSFRLRHTQPVAWSVPVYQGLEHWQEWELAGSGQIRPVVEVQAQPTGRTTQKAVFGVTMLESTETIVVESAWAGRIHVPDQIISDQCTPDSMCAARTSRSIS
jgi:SAM-dependent methyltransferase